jgi:hypothetical protein
MTKDLSIFLFYQILKNIKNIAILAVLLRDRLPAQAGLKGQCGTSIYSKVTPETGIMLAAPAALRGGFRNIITVRYALPNRTGHLLWYTHANSATNTVLGNTKRRLSKKGRKKKG